MNSLVVILYDAYQPARYNSRIKFTLKLPTVPYYEVKRLLTRVWLHIGIVLRQIASSRLSKQISVVNSVLTSNCCRNSSMV